MRFNKSEFENEKILSMLFFNSPEPLSVTSLVDGRFIMVNDAFLKKTGYTESEIINRSSLDIDAWLSPDDRAGWANELVKNGSVRSMEIPLRLKDKNVRSFQFTIYRLLSNLEHLCVQNALRP